MPNISLEPHPADRLRQERELDERQYKRVIQKTINTSTTPARWRAVCFLTELHVKGRIALLESASGGRSRQRDDYTSIS
ncbi:hypothetical protein M8494_25525 [Serratia ureilytica]